MASCLTPFTVKNKKYDPNFKNMGNAQANIAVPCGKCPACYKRRVSQWSFRLMQEGKVSESAYFVTLTYNTDAVPITKNGFMTLDKTDLQKYFKRLRKLNTTDIRYYACGEYGGKFKRPHYHIILFNAQQQTIDQAWHLEGKPIGTTFIGDVTGASIGYSLKYLSKKSQIPAHKNDDRAKEFPLMSKGIGKNYLTGAMQRWHKKDKTGRMYCNLTDGKKISMPRYYKDKLYQPEERKAIGVKVRQEMLKKQAKNELDNPNHYRDKFESDKAAFQKMEKDVKNHGIM